MGAINTRIIMTGFELTKFTKDKHELLKTTHRWALFAGSPVWSRTTAAVSHRFRLLTIFIWVYEGRAWDKTRYSHRHTRTAKKLRKSPQRFSDIKRRQGHCPYPWTRNATSPWSYNKIRCIGIGLAKRRTLKSTSTYTNEEISVEFFFRNDSIAHEHAPAVKRMTLTQQYSICSRTYQTRSFSRAGLS